MPDNYLRWKAPQPARKWEGILPADRFGPASIQNNPAIANLAPPGEDCLYLYIRTPAQDAAEEDIKGYRASQDKIMHRFLDPMYERFPVNIEHKTIAGIYTDIVTPRDGIPEKNRDRVLLNVHGGGFLSGARTAGLVESIPIASIGKFRVITIDYRMGPEYKFPAASEDVASVYKEVLKQYKPENIGLYGCSAGGQLASMSVAWFDRENSPELVAKFPPTLLITSIRAMEFSAAVNSHNVLVKNGVDADLHVWDALPHAFWYNSDLPESLEVYNVISNFFNRHLHR